MKRNLIVVLLAVLAAPASAQAPPAANPMSAALLRSFGSVSDFVVRSAEQFPAEKYSAKAVPEVRSFAEEIGHVADAHYFFCARARGEASPQTQQAEGKITDKTQLVTRLKESVAYCRSVYESTPDAALSETFTAGTNRIVKLAPLTNNTAHDNEHYGKLVMYFRLNGLVPPSSQPAPSR
jgi:uncharacterized damage-inducible protein DinB